MPWDIKLGGDNKTQVSLTPARYPSTTTRLLLHLQDTTSTSALNMNIKRAILSVFAMAATANAGLITYGICQTGSSSWSISLPTLLEKIPTTELILTTVHPYSSPSSLAPPERIFH